MFLQTKMYMFVGCVLVRVRISTPAGLPCPSSPTSLAVSPPLLADSLPIVCRSLLDVSDVQLLVLLFAATGTAADGVHRYDALGMYVQVELPLRMIIEPAVVLHYRSCYSMLRAIAGSTRLGLMPPPVCKCSLSSLHHADLHIYSILPFPALTQCERHGPRRRCRVLLSLW